MEQRARTKLEITLLVTIDVGTNQVGGQQVGCELQPVEIALDTLGEHLDRARLGQPRGPLDEQVTVAAGVPTIWMAVLPELKGRDTSSLRSIPCGGSAVPKSLSEAYREQTGLPILQAWGMTETSPIAAVCRLDADQAQLPQDAQAELRTQVGRIVFGAECRVVEPGTTNPVPWDGESSGELQCRGNWIASDYYDDERSRESFTDDGWLKTGDLGWLDAAARQNFNAPGRIFV